MKSMCVMVGILLASAGVVVADTVTLTYAGSTVVGSATYAAAASFTLDDAANTIRIRISNTMPDDAGSNGAGGRDLSALFWSFTNAPTLDLHIPTASGGVAGAFVSSSHGGSVNDDGSPHSPEQLWGFHDPSSAWSAPGGGLQGLSAAGLGLFSGSDILATGGPSPQPGGLDGTIISPTGAQHPGGQAGHRQQFRSFVEFVFSVDHAFFVNGIDSIGVNNLRAQFDTTLTGQDVPLVVVPLPVPAMLGAAGLSGVAALGVVRRRRWR